MKAKPFCVYVCMCVLCVCVSELAVFHKRSYWRGRTLPKAVYGSILGAFA
jgi:hypothetical protein